MFEIKVGSEFDRYLSECAASGAEAVREAEEILIAEGLDPADVRKEELLNDELGNILDRDFIYYEDQLAAVHEYGGSEKAFEGVCDELLSALREKVEEILHEQQK
jgi:hypothetical protein